MKPKTWLEALFLAGLGFSILVATAQASSKDKFERAFTGRGYAICGSCNVPNVTSSKVTLTSKNESGEPLLISGTIYREDGVTPASGVVLFLYQTDAGGFYHRPKEDVFSPRIHGWLRTGNDGRYEIRTIKPAPEVLVPDEPAHIHVNVFGPGIPEHFLHEFWFEGDKRIKPEAAKELSGRGAFSPILHLTKRGDTLIATRNIRLRPSKQWQSQED